MKLIGVGDLFTIEGAARTLGISYRRMYLWMQRNSVPPITLGKSRLVHISDIQQFAKEIEHARKQPTTAA